MRQNARRFNHFGGDLRRFPAACPDRGFKVRAPTIHIAFSRHCEHGAEAFRNRGFVFMAALAMVCRAAVWCAAMGCAAANAVEAEPAHVAAAKLICLNAAETREEVKARRLIEPFAALKFAAAQRKAEALTARLCHTGDEFVYDITLLNRDGRIMHVEMGAATGRMAVRPARELHEPHETHDLHEPQVKN